MQDDIARLNRNLEALIRLQGGTPPIEIERAAGGGDTIHGGDTINNVEGDTITSNRTVEGDTVNTSTTVNQFATYDEGTGYFTTGPGGITVTDAGSTYDDIEFGAPVGTISIRTDTPLNIAFADPHNRPGRVIPIGTEHSPFTIGGSNPIGVDQIYFQKQNRDDPDAEVHIIAY